jgi:hypothetical protein
VKGKKLEMQKVVASNLEQAKTGTRRRSPNKGNSPAKKPKLEDQLAGFLAVASANMAAAPPTPPAADTGMMQQMMQMMMQQQQQQHQLHQMVMQQQQQQSQRQSD